MSAGTNVSIRKMTCCLLTLNSQIEVVEAVATGVLIFRAYEILSCFKLYAQVQYSHSFFLVHARMHQEKGSLFISYYYTKFDHITRFEDFPSPPFYYMYYSESEVGGFFILLYNTEFPRISRISQFGIDEIQGNPRKSK
jgi:hypothetical protein